jgi:mono/diheme cytochrome c family protein
VKRTLKLSLFLLGLSTLAVQAQDGQAQFQKHCTPCHAPGMNHPGTIQLTLTRGEDNGVLEERDNLIPVYVKTIVRNGLNAMPAFKPTQVTDAELDAIAEYLKK